jgi:catechol 2,3-dioxygenase-like lactoylglutathione lyase family enzyme
MSTFGPERISISVGDLDQALAFYRDWVGFTQVGDYALDPHEIEALWRLPEGTRARSVLLKSEGPTTLLELLDFGQRSRKIIRPNPRGLDLGYWGMSLKVHDLDGIVEDLKARGYRWSSEAFTYTPAFLKFGVRNVVLDGPDHNPIYHYEMLNGEPWSGPRYVELNHLAMLVDDVPAYQRFFGDVLGLVHRGEFEDTGTMNTFYDMPPGAKGREGFFSPAEGRAATMNYVIISPSNGRSLAAVARPPNLGEFQTSFRVDDLAATMAKTRESGFKVILGEFQTSFRVDDLAATMAKTRESGFKVLSGPLEMQGGHLGRRQAATVSGPSGLLVELYQPA